MENYVCLVGGYANDFNLAKSTCPNLASSRDGICETELYSQRHKWGNRA